MLDIASNYFIVLTVKKSYKGINYFETYLMINKSYWNFSTVSFCFSSEKTCLFDA